MTTIYTDDIEPQNESLPVAIGRAVVRALLALPERAELKIDDERMDESQWSELRAYLQRRGITVRADGMARMDHD